MRYLRYLGIFLTLFYSVGLSAQYDPDNPPEPNAGYQLTLEAVPTSGGSFNVRHISRFDVGDIISLRAYSNSGFSFHAWEQDGEVISTSANFSFTMPARDVKLVAHFNYNPDNPDEPVEPVEYGTLFLSASPTGSGYFNVNSGSKFEVGSSVYLRAYSHSNRTFVNWTENDEVISTSSSFNYVMKEGSPHLVAHFDYSPDNPEEPESPEVSHKLFVNADPPSGGYFNVASGNRYQVNTTIRLNAYARQWYTFQNWTWGDSIISTQSNFDFIMPDQDVVLTAHYTYDYDPSNPEEPDEPSTDQVNIYGMTENGVRGQTIFYPIYLENTIELNGLAVDIQFPKGFIADINQVGLSGRVSGQEMEITELGENNYRFRLKGTEAFLNNNGKLFELPVSIPDTATMNHNYPVKLTHGVMFGTDGSQLPVTVRSGYIYVERVSEDGLYAKFIIDKLQNRVKFTNQSSSKSVSFLWDFGDGTTSTDHSPVHMYPSAGEYIVKLTAFGQHNKDEAEMVVLINDESTWQLDGTFFLSDKEMGARYFTSPEALFGFIGSSTFSGNIRISVKSDQNYVYDLANSNISTIKGIQQNLSSHSYTMAFIKHDTGRNPSLSFGSANSPVNSDFVKLFVEWGKNMTCNGVDLRLYGVSFNPSQIHLLNNQVIHSGEKSKEVDLSTISPDVVFSWNLTQKPQNVYGYQTSGVRVIPSMTIINENEQNRSLTYHVKGVYKDNIFCEFDNTITVSPALIGLFTSLSPADGTVTESNTITLSWNSISNAVYDVYLWNAENERPQAPVVSGTEELQYTSENFCQYGNSYKWQVVARNENQSLASDTMHFTVSDLPDLHIYSLSCSEPVAGNKFTVEWTVKNDGTGPTGNVSWKDYIWLISDVFGGTSLRGSTLLASVDNVKALESGESYENSIDITLDERIYGNYYILVATDMYSVNNVNWNSVGGSVINPYNPTQDGSSYKHLFGYTDSEHNKVYEAGETSTYSDNFFYKKIEIAVPNLADLQVPKIVVEADNDIIVESKTEPEILCCGCGSEGDGYLSGVPQLYYRGESVNPSPLVYAGLDLDTIICPGRNIKVTATITNKGGIDINRIPVKHMLYLSDNEDPMNKDFPLLELAAVNDILDLGAGESSDVTFKAQLPYECHGNTYLHVYADIDNSVYELANTFNNWGTYQIVELQATPGADFVPGDLNVSNTLSPTSNLDISYKVENKGNGVPFKNEWIDKVYLSKKNTGIDNTAMLIGSIGCSGSFYLPNIDTSNFADSVIHLGKEYQYQGDNYSKTITVRPNNLTAGTYYIYVAVDADDNVYEPEGEDNNIIMAGPIRLVQPDLAVELVSVSEDTLSTGNQVAITWKLKNTGTGDLQDVKVIDRVYASVNQDGTGGVTLATVENTVWIAAGSDKTLRTNISIPSIEDLDGLRYIFIQTNSNDQIVEENKANNISNPVKSWFAYTTEPSVKGLNLNVSELEAPDKFKPGEVVQLLYTAKNTGGITLTTAELPQEVYLTNASSFSPETAVKCEIVSCIGSPSGLQPGKSARISVKFKVPATIEGGHKNLFFYVDRTNLQGEENLTDNFDVASVFINGNLPDWHPVDFVLPDTLLTSKDYTLQFTMANKGDWNAKVSLTDIFLSPDNKFDYDDLRLITMNTPAMPKGESVQQEYTLNIADKYFGNWYILVKANANDQQPELNKDDNTLAIPITVVQSPLPDLLSSDLSVGDILKAGNKVVVEAKVANVGDHATRNDKWTDAFYLSTSVVLNPQEAIFLGSRTHVGNLQVGQDYVSQMTLNIPTNAQGNYMLFVVTDGTDAIVESNENNNRKYIPVYVNGAADMPSDLAISNVSASAAIQAGESTTISYKVSNLGEYPAEGTLNDVIYFSKDDQWDIDDEMVGTVTGEVSINAGGSIIRNVSGRIVNMPEGNYYVIVKTNATHTIADMNDDNNTAIMSSPCRLFFQTILLDDNLSFKTSGYFKLNVPSGMDGKTIGFYLDHPVESQAGLYGDYESVPSTASHLVGSNNLLESRQEILIPDIKPGNYYILAQDNAALVNAIGNPFVVNGEGEIAHVTPLTLSAREIPFGATTLSIHEGGNKGWVSTDINGALFDSIMDFRLKMKEVQIPAEAVRYNGMTKSRVTFNLNEAQVGTYDVVTELPNGAQATLPNGFKVIPGTNVNLNIMVEAPGSVRQESLIPFSISYANGGNTDCVIYDILLTAEGGALATTVKGLEKGLTALHVPLSDEIDVRGYTTIPPGEQRVVNLFMQMTSRSTTITVYVVY